MIEIRILLVHSLAIFRESLKSLLDDQTDLVVAGESESAGEAIRLVEERSPDVVVMEAGMPGPNPLDAARQIARLHPATKVLFLSLVEDQDALFECMHSGAAGFLSRDTTGAELVQAIRQIARGGKYLAEPALSRFLDGWRGRKQGDAAAASVLTAREKEVLKLLAEGNSVKECADILNVSAKTVEAHKFNLMRKLGIHNKAQLVRYAFQKKIVRLEAIAS
jgi:DNA-binding NarL/FixJ family response regulator